MESNSFIPPEEFVVSQSLCLYCSIYPIDEDINSEYCTHCYNKRNVITALSFWWRAYEMTASASTSLYSLLENYVMHQSKQLTVGEPRESKILDASFNQNASSLSIGHVNGYSTYSTIFVKPQDIKKEHEHNVQHHIDLIERFYTSNLAMFVSQENRKKFYAFNIKDKQEIFNNCYQKEILSIKMNRRIIVIATDDTLYLYDKTNIKEKALHKIMTNNPLGILDLSTKINAEYDDEICHLAFPDFPVGQIRVLDAQNLSNDGNVQDVCIISAYFEPLQCLKFNVGGTKLATASEKGVVIKVFEIPSGNVMYQFTRGISRYVTIHSLAFSVDSKFLCSSSDTDTVHVFKLVDKENQPSSNNQPEKPNPITWTEYVTQTGYDALEMTQQTACTYLNSMYEKATSMLPSQLHELMFHERSFAIAKLPKFGTKTVVAMPRINHKNYILVASYTGYLYVYELNEDGGECKFLCQHIIGPISEEEEYQESRLQERSEKIPEIENKPTAPKLYPSLNFDGDNK